MCFDHIYPIPSHLCVHSKRNNSSAQFLWPICSRAGHPLEAADPCQNQLITPQLGGRDTHTPSHSIKVVFLNFKFIAIKKKKTKVVSTSCHHRGSSIITRLQMREKMNISPSMSCVFNYSP